MSEQDPHEALRSAGGRDLEWLDTNVDADLRLGFTLTVITTTPTRDSGV